jgi:hypothetical protein
MCPKEHQQKAATQPARKEKEKEKENERSSRRASVSRLQSSQTLRTHATAHTVQTKDHTLLGRLFGLLRGVLQLAN